MNVGRTLPCMFVTDSAHPFIHVVALLGLPFFFLFQGATFATCHSPEVTDELSQNPGDGWTVEQADGLSTWMPAWLVSLIVL